MEWEKIVSKDATDKGLISFTFSLSLFFFFFSFLATPWHRAILGQVTDPSLSCDLSHSDGNNISLTHCDRRSLKPVSQHPQDATEWNGQLSSFRQVCLPLRQSHNCLTLALGSVFPFPPFFSFFFFFFFFF